MNELNEVNAELSGGPGTHWRDSYSQLARESLGVPLDELAGEREVCCLCDPTPD